MALEFIPYGKQDIDAGDIEAVVSVLRSDFLTQGPAVSRFETALAQYLGAKHVVALANGTAGLHVAYLAAGIGPGDAVIVPALTFAATANAALYCGATPVFADIDPETLCLSAASLERCVGMAKRAGLSVKAVAPVHYAGRPCDMPAILRVAQEYGLRVIEDACHAVGAEYRLSESEPFQKVGSASFTDMAVFSFHPVKHITTGEGGAVTTADAGVAKSLRALRSHGITKEAGDYVNQGRAFYQGAPNPWYHEMQSLGLNYRLCDIQAALGESQTRRLSGFIARRRQIAAAYDLAFKDHGSLIPAPGDSPFAKHGYHLYPLRMNFERIGRSRGAVMAALTELGIGTQVHYIPVCWHPYYEANPSRWLADDLPEAARLYQAELSLPMYPRMTDAMVERVIAGILTLAQP